RPGEARAPRPGARPPPEACPSGSGRAPARGSSRRRRAPDRGDARAQCPTPRRALPAAPRHPPAPRGSPRAPSLVAGVCFLLLALGAFGRFRLDRGLRLRQGLGLLVLLRLLLTGPLVIGDVESRGFYYKARHPGDLPIRFPSAPRHLLPTF